MLCLSVGHSYLVLRVTSALMNTSCRVTTVLAEPKSRCRWPCFIINLLSHMLSFTFYKSYFNSTSNRVNGIMNYQYYDALAETESVRIKDITSTAANRALLHRIKNNDPGLKSLYISTSDHYGDGDDDNMGIFQVREGDDLGWLGYFIGENEALMSLTFRYLPEDRERVEKFFFGVQRNKSIKGVYIFGRGFSSKSLSVMNLPHATSMTLDYDSYSNREDAHYFAMGLRRCESLEKYHGPVTSELVASLTTLPMLEHVNVCKSGDLTNTLDEGVALGYLLLSANKLKHLDLAGVGIGNVGLRLLAKGLACNSSLTDGVLDLSRNDISDTGAQALASSLSGNGKVRQLNLCNNNIGDTGFVALADSLAHNRALRYLSIAGNTAITETGVRAISRILQSRNCTLEDLRLDMINVGDEGRKILGDALSTNKSLVTLSLGCGENGVGIGDDELRALSLGLSRNSHLKNLNLSGNTAIADVGWRSLKQYVQSPSCALKALSISFINIDDEGAYALADALGQNKSLKSLRFEERGITLRGWKAFLKLICDSSSPNNISLSNHTLCELGGWWGWGHQPHAGSSVRTSLDTFLGMNNQTPNLAAKVKIMHVFPDLDMVLLFQWNTKFLPLVKSWFDTVTSDDFAFAASIQNRKLSAMYKFVGEIAGCKRLPTSSH